MIRLQIHTFTGSATMRSKHMSRWAATTLFALALAGCKSDAERETERQTAIFTARMHFIEDSTAFARKNDSIDAERRRQFLADSLATQRMNDSINALRLQAYAAQSQMQNDNVVREAIGALELLRRKSDWIENSYVLQLNNVRDIAFDLNVRCHREAGGSKTVFISVPSRGTAEIGFQQGWAGNFQPGDWCELIYNDEVLRSVRI